jgi:hypothetical protein
MLVLVVVRFWPELDRSRLVLGLSGCKQQDRLGETISPVRCRSDVDDVIEHSMQVDAVQQCQLADSIRTNAGENEPEGRSAGLKF